MTVQLLRHATLWLTLNNKRILVDPMLAPKDTYPAIPGTGNEIRNPKVDLPVNTAELEKLLAQVDAVLLTHLHNDHWDSVAQNMFPRNVQILCQPADTDIIRQAGFSNIVVIDDRIDWNGITIHRTSGQHGTGEIGILMGTVSGYVLEHAGNSLYIAGDTIWCDDVKQAIDRYHPKYIVVNGGAARFETGDAIVMDVKDVITTARYVPDANIYVVHLETVNHSGENREANRAAIRSAGLEARIFVPADGAVFIR